MALVTILKTSLISLAVKFVIFMLTVVITMPIEVRGLSIKLIPMITLFPKNLTLQERHNKVVEISANRAILHAQEQQQGSTDLTFNFMKNPRLSVHRNHQNGFYVTQVSIGSKDFSPYLILDPAASLSWVQCAGCINCFPVSTGNYNFQESQSYRKLPCNHTLCVPKQCTSDGYCVYNRHYLNGTSSSGMLSTETFTFPTDSIWKAKYSHLVFGCAFSNWNIPFAEGPGNVIAGVLGLNGGIHSMLVQLQERTKKRFSFCLSSLETPTLLQFGDDASASMRRQHRVLQTTPLLDFSPHYFVTVLGVSIGNQRLDINPEVFRRRHNSTGGFHIDTGCPYSFITGGAYGILRGELVKYIARRYSELHPLRRGMMKFDLCYNLTMEQIHYVFPSMTFHFRGADFVMRPEVVFQSFGTVRCWAMLLAIDPTNGSTILGAFQQTNYRFLFDKGESKLYFAPENCV